MIDDRLLLALCIIHDHFSLPRPTLWSDEKIHSVEPVVEHPHGLLSATQSCEQAMPPQMRNVAWHLMWVARRLYRFARTYSYGQVATPRTLRSSIRHLLRALLPTECLEVLSFQGPEVTVQHKARSSHAHAALGQEESSRVGPFVSLS
jgi:hypothetical protein